jgi:hypothetical protein
MFEFFQVDGLAFLVSLTKGFDESLHFFRFDVVLLRQFSCVMLWGQKKRLTKRKHKEKSARCKPCFRVLPCLLSSGVQIKSNCFLQENTFHNTRKSLFFTLLALFFSYVVCCRHEKWTEGSYQRVCVALDARHIVKPLRRALVLFILAVAPKHIEIVVLKTINCMLLMQRKEKRKRGCRTTTYMF